ncbi:MAG: hypothetical protein EOO38_16440, partial [Cytophagaceae bacterium]
MKLFKVLSGLLLIELGLVSAVFADVQAFTYESRPECSGQGAPVFIELNVVIESGEALGYIRLGWWKNNVQYQEDEMMLVDVIPVEDGVLLGSEVR